MRYYIAYGSNLNKRQMRYRCPNAKVLGTAMLQNWQLMFRGSRTGSYLTIEERVGARTPVAVWAVNEADEHNLDMYEGYPTFYYKKNLVLDVRKPNGKVVPVEAFVYIMDEQREYGCPSSFYIRTCAEGYDDFKFDHIHLFDAVDRTISAVKGKAV